MSNEFSNINDIKNRPLYNQKNRPVALVAHIDSQRNYVNADQITELAIKIYRTKNGNGSTYQDLMDAGLVLHKKQAQKTLKYHLAKGTLFTLRDTRAQQYYPSSIRSEVVKKDLQKIGPIDPIGVVVPNQRHISKGIGPLANCMETVILQTLEGYVLPLLPKAPLFIHNMHFKIKLSQECYAELKLPDYKRNKGKYHTEIIGNTHVDYIFYSNGTVGIITTCSKSPHKLETEEDKSRLIAFLGQIRDRLVILLRDMHERLVPDIVDWQMTECDINKDIIISDFFHFSAIKVQVRHLDHLFSIYIKSMGKDTVCRVEERKHSARKPAEFINDIFNPLDGFESRLAEQDSKLNEINDKITRLANNTDRTVTGSLQQGVPER
jgi:hypothetical protein